MHKKILVLVLALLLDIVPESDRVYWREVVRRR